MEGMNLPFFVFLEGIAGTSSGCVSSPHQERQLEQQQLEAQEQLEQQANMLAEVQREQEKRLLEVKQEVAIMQAE